MSRHRKTIPTLTLLTVACGCAIGASVASANSLLSGYGGPGEGNQAILGSTLLNGPSGGAGAGSASPAGSTDAGSPAASGGAAASRSRPVGERQSSSSGRSGEHVAAGGKHASAAGSQALTASSARPAGQAGEVTAPALGLTREDLVYIFLAVGALAFTGALTKQLARRP